MCVLLVSTCQHGHTFVRLHDQNSVQSFLRNPYRILMKILLKKSYWRMVIVSGGISGPIVWTRCRCRSLKTGARAGLAREE